LLLNVKSGTVSGTEREEADMKSEDELEREVEHEIEAYIDRLIDETVESVLLEMYYDELTIRELDS
jgi:hypothetical protein